jgi:hypothetical protein
LWSRLRAITLGESRSRLEAGLLGTVSLLKWTPEHVQGRTALKEFAAIWDRSVGVVISASISIGIVLGEYAAAVRPLSYLVRPILASLLLALLIGIGSNVFGRASGLVAAGATLWVYVPRSGIALAVTGVLAVVIVYRIFIGRVAELRVPLLVAGGTFLVVGLVQLVFLPSDSTHDLGPVAVGPPTFIVLLDGYPRMDTLEELGIDVSDFIAELRLRGFDSYPNATSEYTNTFKTLTSFMNGGPLPSGTFETPESSDEAMQNWALPPGFAYIAPPFGWLTIPGQPTLNPGGVTAFDELLLNRSIFARVSGEYLMEGFRAQLNRALDTLAETEENQVFAHILAPHIPYLYQGGNPAPPPTCWPACGLFDLRVIENVGPALGGFIDWLNPRLLSVIDAILAKHPDAEIVLFSDHGGRFDLDTDEWYRTFLAARTPTRPQLFADSPHPRSILPLLGLLPEHG